MSTTFGIKHNNEMIEVARRHNISNGKVQIDILNPLLLLLPDYIYLTPLDNTAQGITCIKDIKQMIAAEEIPASCCYGCTALNCDECP